MNEKEFLDEILYAESVGDFSNLVVSAIPIRLTVSDTLSVFSYYARREFDNLAAQFRELLQHHEFQDGAYTVTMRLKSPGSIFFQSVKPWRVH